MLAVLKFKNWLMTFMFEYKKLFIFDKFWDVYCFFNVFTYKTSAWAAFASLFD